MPEWIQDITPLIAGLGLGLGVINFLERWWLRRPNIRAKATCGMCWAIDGRLHHRMWPVLRRFLGEVSRQLAASEELEPTYEVGLHLANAGFITITLNYYGFLVKGSKDEIDLLDEISAPEFPCEVQPGMSCNVFLSPRLLAEDVAERHSYGNVKLRGFFKDQLDRTYRTKWFSIDVNEWRKLD